MAFLIGGGLVGRYFMRKEYNLVGVTLELAVQFFVDLCKESLGYFKYEYFSFVAANHCPVAKEAIINTCIHNIPFLK